MTRRWRSVTNYGLRDIDVDAVIRKEILIRQGAAKSTFEPIQGEIISALSPAKYCFVFVNSYRPSDSSIQAHVNDVELQRTLPFGPIGIVHAHTKVVAQIRRLSPPKSPLIDEPVAEEALVYPKDKVISIQKGHRLRRRV